MTRTAPEPEPVSLSEEAGSPMEAGAVSEEDFVSEEAADWPAGTEGAGAAGSGADSEETVSFKAETEEAGDADVSACEEEAPAQPASRESPNASARDRDSNFFMGRNPFFSQNFVPAAQPQIWNFPEFILVSKC